MQIQSRKYTCIYACTYLRKNAKSNIKLAYIRPIIVLVFYPSFAHLFYLSLLYQTYCVLSNIALLIYLSQVY